MEQTERSPYEVLNVNPKASDKEIKKQFRKLALTCHPDTNPDKDPSEFQSIQAAYEMICTPERRHSLHAYGYHSHAYGHHAAGSNNNTSGHETKWAGSLTGSPLSLMLFRVQIMDYCSYANLGYKISGEGLASGAFSLNLEFFGSKEGIAGIVAHMDHLIASEKRVTEQQRKNMQATRDEQHRQTEKIKEETKQHIDKFYNDIIGRTARIALPGIFVILAITMALIGAFISTACLLGCALMLTIITRSLSVQWNNEFVSFALKKPWRGTATR